MKLARKDDILAIQTETGNIVGFHARNLQVAELDQEVWKALDPRSPPHEALTEIKLWNDEIDPEVKDQRLAQGVRSFTINIAQICNLKCSYCAAGGDGTYGSKVKEIDMAVVYDQLRMLLRPLPRGACFVITFLGGEPLIYPDAIRNIARFVELETLGRDIHVRYDMVTNGTLITEKTADLLAKLRCHVTISLDGPPQINDLNRRSKDGKGSSLKTIKGLERLLKIRSKIGSVSVGSVFGKHNTDVVATYRFLRAYKLDSMKFDFAAEDGDAAASQAYLSSLFEVAAIAFQDGGEEELRRIGLFDRYFHMLDSRERVHNHCGAGKSLLQADTSGKLYVCQWFVNDPAEVVGQGRELDHAKLAAYASPLTELNGCQTCWARHLCGGGCMFINKLKNGSKHKKDAEFCTRTRSIIAKGIEYYAKTRATSSATTDANARHT